MKKSLFIALGFTFAMLFSNNIYAGESNLTSNAKNASTIKATTIEGKVVDKNTNETLAGVKIIFDGQKIYTDLDGNFTISNVSSDKMQLKASLISYEEQTVEINPQQDGTLQIQLRQH